MSRKSQYKDVGAHQLLRIDAKKVKLGKLQLLILLIVSA